MVVSTASHRQSSIGLAIPVLGQGTWHVGENPHRRAEGSPLRLGIGSALGFDRSAEMYANGHSEELWEKRSRDGATRFSWSARCSLSMRRFGERSMPASESEEARRRRDRSLPAALARRRAPGRHRRSVRHVDGRQARFATGASATSMSPIWKSSSLFQAAGKSALTRCSTICDTAASNSISCHGVSAGAYRSWPIRRSSRDGCWSIRLSDWSPRGTKRHRCRLRLPGYCASPTFARSRRRASLLMFGRTARPSIFVFRRPIWPNWTVPFLRPRASSRWPRADSADLRIGFRLNARGRTMPTIDPLNERMFPKLRPRKSIGSAASAR